MLPDRVSNPGPLTYESGALPTAWHLWKFSTRFKVVIITDFGQRQTSA